MTSTNDTIFPIDATVLYQAPGTNRSQRVLAKVTRVPNAEHPLYEIDLGDGSKVECCWFAIDTLPVKRASFKTIGIFG
mgnify:CR=1 FL=1